MLKGKNILITGASSGLGETFARLVHREGASRIALAARRMDRLEKLSSELMTSSANNSTEAITCVNMDVSNVASIRIAFEEIESKWKVPVNVIVNNAGVSIPNPFLKATEKEYDDTMNINLKGAFFVCQEGAKRMVANKLESGSIINIASILGQRVATELPVYAMSKAGVIQMTKAAALELARYKIRVNCICPGYILTDMNADFFNTDKGKEMIAKRMLARRLGKPEELGGALLLLASDQSSFMTGSAITVDGGHTIGSL